METCHFTASGNIILHSLTRTMKLAADVRAKLLSHITKSSEIKEMVCESGKLICQIKINLPNLSLYQDT